MHLGISFLRAVIVFKSLWQQRVPSRPWREMALLVSLEMVARQPAPNCGIPAYLLTSLEISSSPTQVTRASAKSWLARGTFKLSLGTAVPPDLTLCLAQQPPCP